jgi:ureidoglycolate lyase
MKLLRFGPVERERPGLIDQQGCLGDVSGAVPDISGDTLSPSQLSSLRTIDPTSFPAVIPPPRIGACVGAVGKIIGVGLNYTDHAKESNMPVPSEPPLFLKPPSAFVGPNDVVEIPRGSKKLIGRSSLAS